MNTSIASNWRPHSRALFAFLIVIAALWVTPRNAQAQRGRIHEAKLVQTNLVSSIPGLATITDPQLHNPWGVSHSSTSPFWVSNQGKNTSTLYTVTDETTVTKVNINPPSGFVAIPKFGSGPAQGPTGQVNNTNTACFPVS